MAVLAIAAGMTINISEKIGAKKTGPSEEEDVLLADVGQSMCDCTDDSGP
jgi:hypothetical protein